MWPDRIVRRIKLRQLEILFAVVECGTMGKAAERLALTQPVISKAIADLEGTLGARLLDRGPQGAEPTLYGRALLKRSVAIFDELRQSVGEIKFLADPTVGELRIACADSMLSGLLPLVINRLCGRHPKLTFHVSQGLSGAPLYRELRERNVDLVLGKVAIPFTESDLKSELFFDERYVVVTGARSPWVRRHSIKLIELINERWILQPADMNEGTAQVSEIFQACGLEVPHAAVHSASIQLYEALAASGQFLAMLPMSVLWFGPKRSSIKVLPVKLPHVPRQVGIVTLKDRTISPVVQLFIDCAKEIIEPFATPRSR
jgi:DNA-binding transcriptional LysR family regulator